MGTWHCTPYIAHCPLSTVNRTLTLTLTLTLDTGHWTPKHVTGKAYNVLYYTLHNSPFSMYFTARFSSHLIALFIALWFVSWSTAIKWIFRSRRGCCDVFRCIIQEWWWRYWWLCLLGRVLAHIPSFLYIFFYCSFFLSTFLFSLSKVSKEFSYEIGISWFVPIVQLKSCFCFSLILN